MPLPALAATAIGMGLGSALGIGSDAISAQRQVNNQKKLIDYNAKTQLQMWKDTNYGPQVEELKKAGLNPGLIYGMSGGGGATAGGGAPGASAQNSATAGMGMVLQAQLLHAQKENIEADTAKKQMETDVIGGVGVQKTMAEASNIAQDTILKQAQAKIAQIDAEVSGETKQDKINQVKAQAIGETLTNELTKSGIEVNKAQINKMAHDIAQGWRRLTIEEFKAEIEANFKDISKIGGNIVEDLYQEIKKILGIKTDQKPLKIGK